MATLRADRTQESRRLLVAAAVELFGRKGYRQTSFIDIAERSGISRGSIPWHFGNKLGLLEAVVDDQLQSMLTEFASVDASALTVALDRLMGFIRQPGTRLFITLLAEAVEVDSPIRRHYARLHAALRQGVRNWIPAKVLPTGSTPEAFAVLLVGTVMGVHAQWRVDPEAVDLDDVEAAIRTLLAPRLEQP